MLNKKILAAAIAASLSTGAYAVDFSSTPVGAPTIFASELVTPNDDGLVVVDGTNVADVSATAEIGFTVGEGTSKYIRVELSGGQFTADSNVSATVRTPSGALQVFGTLSQGGTAGDTVAIFEIAAPLFQDILADATVTIDADEYAIAQSFGMTLSTYETAQDAVSNATPLASTAGLVATISAGSDGEFAIADLNTATVASFFEEFDASTATVTTTTAGPVRLGRIAPSQILLDNRGTPIPTFDADGTAAVASDFYTPNQDVTISGDFSFGDFTLSSGDTCGTSNSFDIDDTVNGSITFKDVVMGEYSLCVTAFNDLTDAVNIEKGNYILEVEDGFTDILGTIVYDTVSIEVPYITTFADYNQRIYLVNNGSQPADYSMSFTSEDGTEATAGAAASGTIPAGEMIVLRATDVVTLDGRTRTSAVIEVSATEGNVTATMQTVNLESGGTDTVVLNANSITAFEE